MTNKEMLDRGLIIAIDNVYLTDSNVVLIRCYGRGTSQYWVREDDLQTVYNSLFSAYSKTCGKELATMKKMARICIMDSLNYYFKNN